ncbi:sensor histidine kinase response regulator [Stemphylium lycopersici]|uniref:histidine kinase n=1 Tax=Stemphylium lycopersici TaxID=183478 RepID=A0A364N147_STELY|nr:sensor histidine kinase response regulator [Stemphylium lycopersici]
MPRYYPRPGFQLSQTDGPGSRQSSPSPAPKSQTPPSTPPPTLDYAPRASDDKALTAFAQLGALRLNARRCLISFFDRKDCFLLAEATKTLSLQTGDPEFDDDRLCFGTTIFPKEQSLCNYTVNLAPKYTTLPLDDPSDLPSLVVNDLSQDKRFCNFPFVKGPPYSRFYAGVPIRSPSGHSIGTYCVLDENPRDGLTPHQLAFLKSMAGTVMRHLERTRAAEDHRRAKIMVKSLGSFAEGKSGLENWAQDPWDTDQPQPSDLPDAIVPQRQRPSVTTPTEQGPTAVNGHNHTDPAMVGPLNETLLPSHFPPSTASPSNGDLPPTHVPLNKAAAPLAPTEAVQPPRPEITTTSSNSTKGFTKAEQKDRVAPELRAHFIRAANMIVDSTEAEGVAFFDAKISTFGGLVDDDFDPDQLPEPDKPCDILGAALCKTDRDTKPLPNTGECISESVLRHLLRLYPHGQIFHLDDDPASPSINSPSTSFDEFESADGFPFTAGRKTESSRSLDDEAYLRRVFPTARSLILYPLWDPHRERWFATAVIWSSEPKRIFTTEQELSYLAAFSNFVMAEVARLDTKLADAAKADFISSISHELRSPLHGILGMTDLLKDSHLDNQQVSHVATIETCGKTLLETINHVLDFAKINNLTRGVSKRQKKRTQSAKHIISPGQAHTNDIMTLINDVDMSMLTEDVVESVFAGYTYAKTSAQTYELTTSKVNRPPISIVLDINHSDNYVFRTQPGAWRRVIMNLFGNSLKYTPGGYIKVKLEAKRKPENEDETCEFRFSVTDSGIGMSEDYINNRLFHSFAQENPLSQGTGLGLSIVKQIVESLGGEVEVRSEKDRGTKFTVTCPLKESRMSPNFCATGPEGEKDLHLQEVTKRTKGLKVRFEGFNEAEEFYVKDLKNKNASKLSLKALDSLCTDWFGMERFDEDDSTCEPDMVVATENCAKALRTQYSQSPGKVAATPVIVVCQGAAAAQSTTAITVPGIIFECIGQPVGPHKMAKALSSCLDRHAQRGVVHKTSSDPALPKISELSLQEDTSLKPNSHLHVVEPVRPPLTSISSAPEIRSVNSSPIKQSRYTKPTRALRCLCVDDNPINLRLLRTFVDKLGHQHILAADGLEALETYKASNDEEESRIDVVLMDINMPVMDGLEATRQIRAHEIRHNLPKVTIIALTGVADTDIQQEANSSGINLFLIKPVRLADLEVILKGVVTGQDKANLEIEAEKERLKLAEMNAILNNVDTSDEKSRSVNVGVAVVKGDDEVQKSIKLHEHKKSASVV